MKHNYPKFEIVEPDSFVPKEAESPEFWVNKNNWFKQWETTGESYYEQKEQEEQKKDDVPVTQPWLQLPTLKVDTKKVFTGYNKQDLDKFNKMYDELGEKDFREFLTKIAGLESKWQYNPRGNKTHSGLYQIKNSYLGHYTDIPDITVEEFVNNRFSINKIFRVDKGYVTKENQEDFYECRIWCRSDSDTGRFRSSQKKTWYVYWYNRYQRFTSFSMGNC